MKIDQSMTTMAAIPAPEANDKDFHLTTPLVPNAEEAKRRSLERKTWNPIPTHQVDSRDLLTWESDASGESGSDASESEGENDDNEDSEEEKEKEECGGGENGCWLSSLERRFSWLIGGKTKQSLLGTVSRMTTIVDSLNWVLRKSHGLIFSVSFGSCGVSSTTIFGRLLLL